MRSPNGTFLGQAPSELPWLPDREEACSSRVADVLLTVLGTRRELRQLSGEKQTNEHGDKFAAAKPTLQRENCIPFSAGPILAAAEKPT